MRHNKSFNHLSRKKAHRDALLANMTISLIKHKRIFTTLAKAKALRVYAEPLITRSKEDSMANRRLVFSYLQNKEAVTELFREMRKDLQDNDCSDWSEAARQWAVNNGIVQGGAPLPDGSANFMWQDMMTREQLVTVLYRFAQKLGMI